MKLNLLIVVLILTVNNISAQTWDGGGGDNNWSTAANWSGDAVPTGSAAVTFNGTSTKDVTIDNVSSWSGGSFTISSGYTGTITQNTAITTGAFSQADGTFTGGASTLDINSSYAISGGTFTAPSGSMTVVSSFTQTGSPTWNHNSGTLTFDGTTTASIDAPDLTFNTIAINISGVNTHPVFTVTSGTTVPLSNDPTTYCYDSNFGDGGIVNNGIITVGTGTWSLAGLGSFTNNSTITTNISALTVASGAVTNNGNWTNSNATSFDFNTSYTQGASASFTCASDATANFAYGISVASGGGASFLSGHSLVTFDGGSYTCSIDAPDVTFTKVVINKGSSGGNAHAFTIASGTTIPLGNNPSSLSVLNQYGNALFVNNGTITVGTGTSWSVIVNNFTNNGTINTSIDAITASGSFTNNSTWTNTNAGSFDLNINYTHGSSATLTCASGATANIAGYLTVNSGGGGDFLAGHSLITFDGGSYTCTIDASDVTFTKVVINKGSVGGNNSAFTIASGSTIPLGNDPAALSVVNQYGNARLINNGTINVGTGASWSMNIQNFTNNGNLTTEVNAITGSGTFANNSNWTNTNAVSFDFNINYTHGAGATLSCAADATANIAGNLTVTSGGNSFLSGHSLITFDGGSYTCTINASDVTFTKVIINKGSVGGNNSVFTISSGTTIPLGDSPPVLTVINQYGNAKLINNGIISIGTGTWQVSTQGFTNNGSVQTKTTSKSFSGSYTENGTVEFIGDGDAAADTYTITDFLSSYNNLSINSTDGSTDTYQLGSAASLAGDFTLTTGTFADEGYTLSVNGDAVNNGTHTGSGKISLTGGSSSHSVSGTGSFTNLELNDANGASLASGQTVNGTLTVTTGDFDLNGNTLTLGTSGTISESAGNTLTGTSGTVSTTRSLNAPSSENVGGMGVILTSTSDLGSTVITRGHSTQTIGGNESIYRYFELVPTNNSGLDATVVFTFDESELNSISESNLMMCKSTSPYTNWTDLGGSVDEGGNTVTVSGVDSFSRFTLGDESQPMPVELVSFTAEVKRDKVILKWKTATEVNNYGYEVQRSATSLPGRTPTPSQSTSREKTGVQRSEFEKIGFVEGAGNSNSEKSYSYIEKMKETGVYYYRLKQIDMDGSYDYSDEVEITFTKMPQESKILQNYPNPFNPRTVMSYELSVMSEVRIVVYDILGNELSVLVDGVKEAGIHEVEFDGTNLSSGMYFYTLTTGSVSITRKMLLLK